MNFQTDPRHCGRCNHDCLGGACEFGACQPVTLATGQYAGRYIVVDSAYAYWGRGGSSPNVTRARIDGTGGTLVLAPGELGRGLSLGNGRIYWMFNGAVRACPAPDCLGGPSSIASSTGTTVGGVFAAPSVGRVYFAQPSTYNARDGGLWSAPLVGGTAQRVANAPENPSDLTSDGTYLYWSNSSTYTADSANSDAAVLRMPLAGGSIAPLLDDRRGDLRFIAIGGGSIYLKGSLFRETDVRNALYKIPLPNGVGTSLPPIFADLVVEGLVTDDQYVYFTSETSVYRCPHSGCATPPEVIAAGQDDARGMAQDAISVYWVTDGTPGTPESAAVRRLAK